ncbi:MAG: hypothetical protein KDJ35_09390 [Alphaproteobacteria bacterium]|nr:hypothetical protein [Alphaproteobacteria bacterium]
MGKPKIETKEMSVVRLHSALKDFSFFENNDHLKDLFSLYAMRVAKTEFLRSGKATEILTEACQRLLSDLGCEGQKLQAATEMLTPKIITAFNATLSSTKFTSTQQKAEKYYLHVMRLKVPNLNLLAKEKQAFIEKHLPNIGL